MATTNADIGNPSLLDSMKRLAPDGSFEQEIVEPLSRFNPLLQDSVWKQGNMHFGDRVSRRVGLPTIGPRQLNVGVSTSRSKFDQFDEAIALIDGVSQIDCALAEMEGDPTEYRKTEDKGYVMAFMNQIENYFFNASIASDPRLFNGFTPRFNSSTAVETGAQVVKVDPAASGADQNSIWLVGWGLDTCYGIYPRGTQGGIRAEAWDKLPVVQSNGSIMVAYQTYWQWHVGLVVKDPRFVARCCNLDTADASITQDLIIPAMIFAYHKIYNPMQARFAWYGNRFAGAYLQQQARNKTQYQLKVEEPGGQPIVSMMGIPFRISDALTSTEAKVN